MPGQLYKPKVFISHSSKNNNTKDLCLKIAKALQGKFEVLLDKAVLEGGDSWRSVIDEWIWNCDAAVILLSPEAAKSEYVKYEATHLRQRWKAHPDSFILLPVLLPGVDEELLNKRMGPIQLHEIQALQALPNLGEKTVGVLIKQLLQRLIPLIVRARPRNKIEEHLFDIFREIKDERLKEIGQSLQVRKLPPGAKDDRALVIVRELMELKAQLGEERFKRLIAVVDKTRFWIPDHAFRIVNALAPFCWVDPQAAVKLAAISQKIPHTRAVAWGRKWNLSERMYLFRTFCNPHVRTIYVSDRDGGTASQSGQEAGSFMRHVHSCLSQRLGCSYGESQDDPESELEDKQSLRLRIKKLEDRGEPVFLIIPAAGVDKETVKALLDEWPHVTLFFYKKDLTLSEFEEWQFPDSEFLSPPLDPKAELSARQEYVDIMTERLGLKREKYTNPEDYLV